MLQFMTSSQTSFLRTNAPGDEFSGVIALNKANEWIERYKDKRLQGLVNTKNEELDGFSFDVQDIKSMLVNLDDEDIIHVRFAVRPIEGAKEGEEEKEVYTLVISAARSSVDRTKHFFIHDDLLYPWFEYSKPCPPRCPQ